MIERPPIRNRLEGDEKLVAIEEQSRSNRGAIEERGAARADRAPPTLEKLRQWCLTQRGLPRSGLCKAIDYMLGPWKGLTVFVDDPFVPLTNKDTERELRTVVLGRKNHLGSKSERDTEVAAILCTLIEIAYLNGLDPYKYLVEATYAMLEDPTVIPLPLAALAAGCHEVPNRRRETTRTNIV